MPKSLFSDDADWQPEQQPLQPAERPLQPAQRAPFPPAQGAAALPRSAPVPSPPPSKAPTRPRAEPAPQSPEQLVKEQFRARFRRQLLLTAIMFPAAIAAKLNSRETHSPLELTGLAVFFVGLILTLINWRCPSCNRYLYRRIYPSRCPRCGVTFHD
jgi:hypothetical protein